MHPQPRIHVVPPAFAAVLVPEDESGKTFSATALRPPGIEPGTLCFWQSAFTCSPAGIPGACVGGGDKIDETFTRSATELLPRFVPFVAGAHSGDAIAGFIGAGGIRTHDLDRQRCSSIGIHRRVLVRRQELVRVLTRFPARAGFEPAGCQCTPTGIRLVFRIQFSKRRQE